MILSNIELHRAIDAGRLIIEPEPTPRFPAPGAHCPYDTHTVDLRLGDEIVVPNPGIFVYDHAQPERLSDHISRYSERFRITNRTPFKLERDQFVLGITHERIHLPIDASLSTCLAARIEWKSSRARCGLLIHFTAPTVHPGFEGRLVLEIINLGPSPILLTPGMFIAQLIVEEVKGIPSDNDPSEFQGQNTPTGGNLPIQ